MITIAALLKLLSVVAPLFSAIAAAMSEYREKKRRIEQDEAIRDLARARGGDVVRVRLRR